MRAQRWTRRAIVAQCAALSGGTLLAGCRGAPQPQAPGQPSRGPVKIVYWAFGGGGPLGDRLFRLPAEEYMKRVPNVTVEYTTVPSGEIQEKTLVAWSSDTGPDVVFDSSRMFIRFMDLDPFLDVTKDFAQRKFKPADFYETSLRFYQIDGKQLGLPQGWGTSVYGMNHDLFRSAGVPLTPGFDEHWTQDDLIAMLKQVVRYDAEGRMDPGGANEGIFLYWLWNYGADLLTADQTKAAVNSPEGLAAAEWYTAAHQTHRVFMRPGIDLRQGFGFVQGNVAIEGNAGPFALNDWKDLQFNYDVALRPRGPKGRIHRMYIDGFVGWAKTKVRDAAVDFMFFLIDDGCAIMERNGGYNIPAYRKVVDEVFLPNPARVTKRKWLQAAEVSKTDPRHAKWIPDISGVYNKYTGEMRAGRMSPREALGAMEQEINVILTEYQRAKR